jgi:hypothetical protein
MKDDLVISIIQQEWPLFTSTQNVDHRSPCQDQMANFIVSRHAYWSMYSTPVLQSYLHDLEVARMKGHNLVTFKYGYMMEATHPDEFLAIKDKLPSISNVKLSLVTAIMALYMKWELDIQLEIPGYDTHHRPIQAKDNSLTHTSVETYMTGELQSYSENTLECILAHFLQCSKNNINPVQEYLKTLQAGAKR